jgi:hypothetical protein
MMIACAACAWRSQCNQEKSHDVTFLFGDTPMNDGTLKVTPITSAQPQVAAKFSITCNIDGFPVSIEAEGKADNLRALVDRLKAIGAQPPQVQTPAPEPTKPAGAPKCPVHNSPMKEGRRGYFCPKKVGDDYCKEVA